MAQKGSSFERSICKQLSKWCSNEKSDSIFWRTSTSGARATVRAKKGLETPNSYGDVCAIDPIGAPLIDLVSIELKRGYSGQLTLQDLLDSKQKEPLLLKFWKQAERDREIGKRRWSWLIFQRDRRQTCIMFNGAFRDFLFNYTGHLKYSKSFRLLLTIHCVSKKVQYKLHMMRLVEFLDYIDPEIFKAYAEEIKGGKWNQDGLI